MQRSRALFRIALVAVLAVTAYGAIDPGHSPWIRAGPDELEHAVLAFLMTALFAAAFPRLPVSLCGGGLVAAGFLFEAVQWAGLVAGSAEAGDALANVVGVGAAGLALLAARVRERGRNGPDG